MGTPYIGGETPALITPFQFVTCEAPAGTSDATPVVPGDIFRLTGATVDGEGSGLKLTAAVAADALAGAVPLVRAETSASSATDQMNARLLKSVPCQVWLQYDGAVPTIGQSIAVAAGNPRRVTGVIRAAGGGIVLGVDTANTRVFVQLGV